MHAEGLADDRATQVRFRVVGLATVMSLLLYLDRFCISICTNYIRQDLNVTTTVVSLLSTAFFFAYALCQVPSGWLTDRFGVRLMLSLYILAWSAFTGMQAFATNFAVLAILQLCCGMAQAGAYPAGARLIRDWNAPTTRGFGSAMVALGGRIGGALAPILTAGMLVLFVPPTVASLLTPETGTYLKSENLAQKLIPPHTGIHRQRLEYTWNCLDGAAQRVIIDELASHREKSQKPSPVQASGIIAQFSQKPVRIISTADQHLSLILNQLIQDPKFYRADLFDEVIEKQGLQLSRKLARTGALSEAEHQRLNRLALEAMFSGDLGNIFVRGWRPSMLVYGVIGIVIAALFWWQVRDTPDQDPRCNHLERRLIHWTDSPPAATSVPVREAFPWLAMLTNISLWGNCLLQFTTNVGWVFLVRTMPQYLEEFHQVPLITRGWMTSVPIWAGVFGVFFGGRLTDWLCQRLGLKWGRRIPVVITRFTAAAGYGICIALSLLFPRERAPLWMPWVYVVALSLVAVSVDIGVPSIWAFMQDVGGKYTASVLGWGNMWGNFGAAAATPFYAYILGEKAGLVQWNLLFSCLGGAFLLGAVGALVMDATRPLTAVRDEACPEAAC